MEPVGLQAHLSAVQITQGYGDNLANRQQANRDKPTENGWSQIRQSEWTETILKESGHP